MSSNERYKDESEGDSFIISNVVDVDDEYVNGHLRKRACASGSTGDEVINLKRCKHLTDRTGHGGLTEEVDVLPCDDLSVNRKRHSADCNKLYRDCREKWYDSKRLPCRSEFWLCT